MPRVGMGLMGVDRLKNEVKLSLSRSRRIRTVKFNLNIWTDEASLKDFRFCKNHIGMVSKLLNFPERGFVTQRCGYKAPPVEVTAILLRRISYPVRWHDLEIVFGRSRSALSEIFLEALESAYATLRPLNEKLGGQLFKRRAPMYANRVHEKGAALENLRWFH